MPYQHVNVKAGDPVRSAEWNAMGAEVARLGTDKISRTGEESLDGPLTVRGALTVGTESAGGSLSVRGDLRVDAAVHVTRSQEDGKDPAHGALVLGTDAASAALRIGYSDKYSWLQGQGQQPLAINPHGGNVGIGTATPAGRLHVNGDTVWNEKAGQRFFLNTRQNTAGDYVQLTVDNAAGNWDLGKGITIV
ncbi:MAG TPA: hypothetical protein VGX50_10790, partial [Longimicrobium sp.]|nr:hypothetical protein [Longimicrobium sp.]